MITSQKVYKLIKTFERVLPHAGHEGALNMREGSVSIDRTNIDRTNIDKYVGGAKSHYCGTVHCHAGWYLLGKKWNLHSQFLTHYNIFKKALGIQRPYSYSDGAEEMAKDLGFNEREELEDWAENNPSIWGNEFGINMFFEECAFTGRIFNYCETDTPTITLKDIIKHWKGVHDRLEKLEKESQDEETARS